MSIFDLPTLVGLSPIFDEYPFELQAYNVFRELKMRNWKVPGITVEWSDIGTGSDKSRCLFYVSSEDFAIRFRSDRSLKEGLAMRCEQICIAGYKLSVYDDHSGPRLQLYVGNDWERDKEAFLHHIQILAKLYDEPKTYLVYTGSKKDANGHPEQLICINDLDREYSPEGDEPAVLDFDKVCNDIAIEIGKIAKKLSRLPIPRIDDNSYYPIPERIPFTSPFEEIIGHCNGRAYDRIKGGQEHPDKVQPKDNYAISPSLRLVNLHFWKNAWGLDDRCGDGFIWCTPIKQGDKLPKNEYDTLEPYPVRIRPQYGNEIYVIDQAVFDKVRMKFFDNDPSKERLTDDELGQAYLARARTLIPIGKYKAGAYEQPMILIRRDLDLNEVELVK